MSGLIVSGLPGLIEAKVRKAALITSVGVDSSGVLYKIALPMSIAAMPGKKMVLPRGLEPLLPA